MCLENIVTALEFYVGKYLFKTWLFLEYLWV